MKHLIIYTPSQDERGSIAAAFSVPLKSVPTRLTRGTFDPTWNGVTFGERLGRPQISLCATGKPNLIAALERARSEDRRKTG